MIYKLNNFKISIDKITQNIETYICKLLDVDEKKIRKFTIINKSVDARRKQYGEIYFIYSVTFEYESKIIIPYKKKYDLSIIKPKREYENTINTISKNKPQRSPIIVGFGPSGIFAALKLAQQGYNPIVLERGRDIDNRKADVDNFWAKGILDEESNVQFGEGGAGTFSDGKLTTRVKDPLCREILTYLVEHGAPEEILYLNKPHVGTDKLRNVIKNIREKIIKLGGRVIFESKVTDFIIKNEKIEGVIVNNVDEYYSNQVILAIGHSARDSYEIIYEKGIQCQAKGFAMGLRIEHKRTMIDKSQYGKYYDHPFLKAANYQLTFKDFENKRGVYTFCMCPGGKVVASSSEQGGVVVNGMSNYARDAENSNSAIVVTIAPEDFNNNPIEGINFQRKYERLAYDIGGKNYNAPSQLLGDFIKNKQSKKFGDIKPSYRPGVELVELSCCLPNYVVKSLKNAIPHFNNKLSGFYTYDAILTGVETRTSSPFRILRNNETGQSNNTIGLYPIGEGAGYAGGIMSASTDGIKCAYKIIENYE